MKLYRGVSKKKCASYKRYGIPKGERFSNRFGTARNWGKGGCVIVVEKNKNFVIDKESKNTFKILRLGDKDYRNTKRIKRFKIK